jgi:hypothetical protein
MVAFLPKRCSFFDIINKDGLFLGNLGSDLEKKTYVVEIILKLQIATLALI